MSRGNATFRSAPIRANLSKHAGKLAIFIVLVLELASLTNQSPSAHVEFEFQDISITVNAGMTSMEMLAVKFSRSAIPVERITAIIEYKGWTFSANREIDGKTGVYFSCSRLWSLKSDPHTWCNVSMNNINECDAIELSMSIYLQGKPDTIVGKTVSLTTQNFRMHC